MKKRLAAATILLLAAVAAHAGTFAVFGPRDYKRETGQPDVVTATFAITHMDVPHKLRLVNGGADGAFAKVTSAVIKVNGVAIIESRDFTGKTGTTIEKTVTLAASNQVSVELRGDPGAGITLSILGEDNTPPAITATVTPAPNAAGWNSDIVTVTFACSDALTGITSCSAPVTVTAEGITQVTGTATDGAGNIGTKVVPVKIDKTPPAITVAAPAQDAVVAATRIDVSGGSSDALAGIDTVTCNAEPATLTGESFTCRPTLADGASSISLVATDRAENSVLLVLDVRSDTTAPSITIETPGGSTNVESLTVRASVSDDDQVASVQIGGQPATLDGGQYAGTVSLTNGANTIPVKATDRAGNPQTKSLQVTRYALPAVAITAPEDLVILRDAVITVSGTATDASSVVVNGVHASVSNGTFTATGIPLAQGRTVVTARATSTTGAVATSSILVYRDSLPPRVVLSYPLDGMIVRQPTIDVTGMVDDIVVGTINSEQMRVTVNGVQAVVANRAFVANGITLTPGLNTIRVAGTDHGGNSGTVTATVRYDVPTGMALSVYSGNHQSGSVSTALAAPLSVKVTENGVPVAGKVVAFEVVENNGTLSSGSSVNQRVVNATTDANGIASAAWTLGTRAGAGNNRVSAVATGVAGAVQFSATGQTGQPAQIVVDSGDAQYGAVGSPLPRPLVAIVIDGGQNRLAGVPVTFSVLQGNGTFDGLQQVTVTTDSDGRAWATPTIGQASINVFQANTGGVQNGAGFQAFGKVAGAPEQTAISGVILDNTDLPVPGVSVRIDGTTLVAQADHQGQFRIPQAPVGYVKLIVDGSTAIRPGTWPTLEYAMYTISGANNTLEMPIHILPIDTRRGLFVDETNGGTLTIPELPGFALTIKPGSATFPGGGRTGVVSVTMVHADKVPMSPGFGQQPRFIITIQPPGVHFDPPAPMTFPNVDSLAPGAITEMYSFDHDLGQFVSIGTASVSNDGLVLTSDPGVGIIKGGWHCGGNPIHNGTTANCPTCNLCLNDHCNNPYTGHEQRSSNPDDMCCVGAFFNLKTNCCGGPEPKHLVGKRFTGFTDCPGWVADRNYPSNKVPPEFDYNGCSIPDIPFLTTSNANNPAYGQYTELSGVVQWGPYKGPQNGHYTLPCDAHDECYQRCNPSSKGVCESHMFQNIMSVCNYAELSGEDPVTVANCKKWADKIRDGLEEFGTFAFMSNQKKACLCCADSSNPF